VDVEIEWQQAIPEDYRVPIFVECEPDVLGQSFVSALAGEQITVHLPESTGSVYLSQPAVLRGKVGHDAADVWGQFLPGGTQAKIQRLGFTGDLSDVEVVAKEMRGWIRRLRSWLDITTGQPVTAVGATPPREWKNRTCLFYWETDGSARSCSSVRQGFDPMYPLGSGLATRDTLRTAIELAGTGVELPMPWVLLRDARALHRVTHTRRAVMECGSAVEMANVRLLTDRGTTVPNDATLGRTFTLLENIGYPLPGDHRTLLLAVRNREVHMNPGSGFVSEAESARILEITTSLVEAAFPLPSALKRLW
jgi:hypothetical protein